MEIVRNIKKLSERKKTKHNAWFNYTPLKQTEQLGVERNFLEGLSTHLLRSQFLKIAPSYPYKSYLKLYYNYKYQGIISGSYKDRLSGSLNLLVDLGLKEDLTVLKEVYDRNISFFKNSSSNSISQNNIIAKLNVKQKHKLSATNDEKNKLSIYFDYLFETKYILRSISEDRYKLKLRQIKL